MFLDEAQVRSLLRMEELIPAMAEAMRDFVRQSPAATAQICRSRSTTASSGADAGLRRALGAKLVTFFPNNEGIPTHHAMIRLFRPETGEPLVTMDGRLITEMRTAAVSAVATDLLARREASTSSLFSVRACRRRVISKRCESLGNFAKCASGARGTPASLQENLASPRADSVAEAVRGADVIVVATSATTPCCGANGWRPARTSTRSARPPQLARTGRSRLVRAKSYVESAKPRGKESAT